MAYFHAPLFTPNIFLSCEYFAYFKILDFIILKSGLVRVLAGKTSQISLWKLVPRYVNE